MGFPLSFVCQGVVLDVFFSFAHLKKHRWGGETQKKHRVRFFVGTCFQIGLKTRSDMAVLRNRRKNMVQQGPTRFFIDWGNGEKHLNAWANDGRCLTSDVGHPMSDTFPPRLITLSSRTQIKQTFLSLWTRSFTETSWF